LLKIEIKSDKIGKKSGVKDNQSIYQHNQPPRNNSKISKKLHILYSRAYLF
jgi:hypothetical protein